MSSDGAEPDSDPSAFPVTAAPEFEEYDIENSRDLWELSAGDEEEESFGG